MSSRKAVIFIKILVIICFSISAILLVVSVCYLLLYIIFEHKEHMLRRTTGTLKSLKRKKDVLVWGRNGSNGPLRVVAKIKDWRKGTYVYTANNKSYKTHLFSYDDPSGVPYMVQIIYLKIFPKISYVKTDTNFNFFEIYSFAAFAGAVCFITMGIFCIF